MLLVKFEFVINSRGKCLQNSLSYRRPELFVMPQPKHFLSTITKNNRYTLKNSPYNNFHSYGWFPSRKLLSHIFNSSSPIDLIKPTKTLRCGIPWQRWLSSSMFDVNGAPNISKNPDFTKLQNFANLNRADASIQAQYLKSVVDYDPEYVVRRFESGLYASDAACRRIYLEALSKLSDSPQYNKIPLPIKSQWQQQQQQQFGPNANQSPHTESPSRFGFLKSVRPRILEILLILLIGYGVYNSGMQLSMRLSNQEIHMFSPDSRSVTFQDVKGCIEPKEELLEVVEFLKNPSKFTRLGATIPKGILLIGPPGTGKTLLARAVAGEAGVPFFFCSGSEFDEVFVGLGASRIRKIFEAARAKTPCIIFIDELDALGGKRNSSDANYNRQTLNQFLVELDGFKKDSNLIVIAATNLPESLDKALVRSGRFDNQIYIPLPSYNDRVEIFELYMKKVKTHPSVSSELLANLTPGLSGADISNLVNQAAQHASIADKNFVTLEDFDWAREKVAFGRERKSLLMTEHDKKITAYHEAGHAVTAFYTKNANKLHKATIVPRGSSLGTTQTLPERERVHETYEELRAHMDVCLGGRVAEEIIFGKDSVTTGCTSDLTKATEIARAMVMLFGMNQKVGYISTDSKQVSDATLALIDKEVKILLDKSYERVRQLLSTHSEQHNRLAAELIKRETLVGDDLENVILGRNPNLSV